jgi:hypothetical protein
MKKLFVWILLVVEDYSPSFRIIARPLHLKYNQMYKHPEYFFLLIYLLSSFSFFQFLQSVFGYYLVYHELVIPTVLTVGERT